MSPKKRASEPAFEEALERLEAIVAALEKGDQPLDESLRLFEEGIGLTRRCAAHLDRARRRIDVLTRDAEGRLELQPFRLETDAPDDGAVEGETD
jgi:exodeoxyribonuclease VII small subunit